MKGTKYTESQVKRLEKFFATIKTPEGYERTCAMPEANKEYSMWEDYETGVLTIKGEDVEIIFRASFYKNKLDITGTTNFKEDSSWYTFDRRGIEDSFYMEQYSAEEVKSKKKRGWYDPECDTKNGGQAMLDIQIKRAKDRITEMIGMLTVPHYGHRITEERKEEIRKKILNGGHTFAPSGMGTAYHVSTKRRSRFDSEVPAEVAKFFGIDKKLYAQHQDWD
jgi:hypothetical protein